MLGFSTFSVHSFRLTWIGFERFWFGFSDSFPNYLGKLTFHYFRIDVAIPRNSVAIPSRFHDGLQYEPQFSLCQAMLLQYLSLTAVLQVLQYWELQLIAPTACNWPLLMLPRPNTDHYHCWSIDVFLCVLWARTTRSSSYLFSEIDYWKKARTSTRSITYYRW